MPSLAASGRKALKSVLARTAPGLFRKLRTVYSERMRDPKNVFGAYFKENLWGDDESRSGGGSNIVKTETLRRDLPQLLRDLNVKVFVDAPCGDFNWMSRVELPPSVHYVGCDVVDELIEDNRRRHGGPDRAFEVRNIVNETLPRADLIMCRDCLIHLTNRQVRKAIDLFKNSGTTWLAVTHDVWAVRNEDTTMGGYRPINFEKPPFSFPSPVRLLFDGSFANEEQLAAGQNLEPKHLAVWRVSDL